MDQRSKALALWSERVRRLFRSKNLWIAHRDGKAITEIDQNVDGLRKYLERWTSKEDRQFDQVAFLPGHVFKKVFREYPELQAAHDIGRLTEDLSRDQASSINCA